MIKLKLLLLNISLIFLLIPFDFTAQADSSSMPYEPSIENEQPDVVLPENLFEGQPVPWVTGVYSNNPLSKESVTMGEELVIRVKHIDVLVKEAHRLGKNIVLYINNIPVRDAEYNYESHGLSFLLGNSGDVIDLWDHLLLTRGKGEFFHKKVSISVGIDEPGYRPLSTDVSEHRNQGFTIIIIQKSWFWLSILIILGMIAAFVALAIKTDMLRDNGPKPATGRKPYSLGRTQMGIWSITILSSWLFLYVCLHHFNLFTESTLILLGIASATGVGGFAVDTSKKTEIVLKSAGFWKDLVSDSLFRFQNMMWTVILVLVFIRSVLAYLKMPEFDEKLLMLMGISSGTYLGAKVTQPGSKTEALAQEETADEPPLTTAMDSPAPESMDDTPPPANTDGN